MVHSRLLSLTILLSLLAVTSGFRTFDRLPVGVIVVNDTIPPLNQKMVEFVDANLKKKVGRGECWDVAAEALAHAGASWDGRYEFGKLIDPEQQDVLPGDILQFENVVARDRSGNVTREERMGKHTAIVYRVLDTGVYDIAHQNTDLTGRKLGVSRFLLDSVVRGKVLVYRPSN